MKKAKKTTKILKEEYEEDPTLIRWGLDIEIEDPKKLIKLITLCYNHETLKYAKYHLEYFQCNLDNTLV